jgi:hypothetical protein
MRALCALDLIDWPGMREVTGTGSAWSWMAAPGLLLLALAVGCTAAPLDGKPCPCVSASGYFCCGTTMTCVTDAGQCPANPCTSKPLTNRVITQNSEIPQGPTDCGAHQLTFGIATEPWVSYTYSGMGEPLPCLEPAPNGGGLHVTETFSPINGGTLTFAGVGLAFNGDGCIDGTNLRGLLFDFNGDLGGSQLTVGVVSNNNISAAYPHGTCTAGIMCYGPTAAFNPVLGINPVLFSDLTGPPTLTFDPLHILNVQWQVSAGTGLSADFTIRDVEFF